VILLEIGRKERGIKKLEKEEESVSYFSIHQFHMEKIIPRVEEEEGESEIAC